MPSSIAMKEFIPKKLFLSMILNKFFGNHKDVINQLSEKQIKLTKINEWNIVNWYKLYNINNPVAIQRIICLITFFDFAKKF